MKILVAEDDSASREVLETYMATFGACDVATDGMEAIDKYLESLEKEEPYDLLCLDIMMPKVDGLKVLGVIRGFEEQHDIPEEERTKIVMVTAVAAMECVDEAFELGCDAYASKPIDLKKIEELMGTLGFQEPKN